MVHCKVLLLSFHLHSAAGRKCIFPYVPVFVWNDLEIIPYWNDQNSKSKTVRNWAVIAHLFSYSDMIRIIFFLFELQCSIIHNDYISLQNKVIYRIGNCNATPPYYLVSASKLALGRSYYGEKLQTVPGSGIQKTLCLCVK